MLIIKFIYIIMQSSEEQKKKIEELFEVIDKF